MAVPELPQPIERMKGRSEVDRLAPLYQEACRYAVRLFGLGYDQKTTAKGVADILYRDKEWDRAKKLRMARQKLREWRKLPWFRDMVYQTAVVELDLDTPQILQGVAAKAKRGRVDAAKLALSLVDRYSDKSSEQPQAVTINLVAIPRPLQLEHQTDSGAIEIIEED